MACKRSGVRAPLAPPGLSRPAGARCAVRRCSIPHRDEFPAQASPNGMKSCGEVYLDGVDISKLRGEKLRQQRKQLQMIFQDPYASLDPRMTVGDIIAEPLVNFKMISGRAKDTRVQELLRTVGLNPYFNNRYPHEFSGGQRQRISNRVMVKYLGKIVEVAPSEDLYTSQEHPYTRALLSSIPVPDPRIESKRRLVELSGESLRRSTLLPGAVFTLGVRSRRSPAYAPMSSRSSSSRAPAIWPRVISRIRCAPRSRSPSDRSRHGG
jgi:oligopeptide/dipeptide ABC transporter ATP-binding protein